MCIEFLSRRLVFVFINAFSFPVIDFCNLLVLDDDNFYSTVGNIVNSTWTNRKLAILQIPMFRSWSSDDIILTTNLSKIRKYGDDEVIVSPSKETEPYFSFLLTGKCVIIKEKSDYEKNVHKYRRQKTRLSVTEEISRIKDTDLNFINTFDSSKFVEIARIGHGQCYGLGE